MLPAFIGGVSQCPYASLSRVIASSRMRLPVAWYTALAMAAATPVMPISPTPRTPNGLMCGSGISRKCTSKTGMSA